MWSVREGGKPGVAGVDILHVPGMAELKLGNRSGMVIKVWESERPLPLPNVPTGETPRKAEDQDRSRAAEAHGL